MTEHSLPDSQPFADVLMRRMLNLMTRLNSVCTEDAAELAQLRERRQAGIVAAERDARKRTEQVIATSPGLSAARSLGSSLRTDLDSVTSVHHADSGPPPVSFNEAVADWKRIAPSAERRVREFRSAHDTWQQRFIRRVKSAPVIDDSLWGDLDRLDLIHRSLPALKESYIASAIQATSDTSDVVLEGEATRRAAGQDHLATELKSVLASFAADLSLPAARWSDPRWNSPEPARSVQRLIRIGELAGTLPPALGIESIPALIEFPFEAGVAVRATVDSRGEAVELLRALILRLLAAVPPGALQVKVVDPVALGQSVAEFRHLAEYDDKVMDEKTWTSERDIERLTESLTDHIELVISQYLKGQFETIDEYNEHAGEVSQPYRVLVVFDFPNGFSERASRQLVSLVENGPRCGVYTLLHHSDVEGNAGESTEIATQRITRAMHRIRLGSEGAELCLPDPVGQIDLRLFPDQLPPVEFDEGGAPQTGGARLLAAVGTATKAGHDRPTAVTLETLLPVLGRSRTGVLPDLRLGAPNIGTDPSTWWSATTASTAVAPIGRSGAQQVASLYFSSTDIAGGAIMVGLPRSGKTTSLHAAIMTMAMLYSPDELELYLIDAKHGVEFKVYEKLPHARMVSVNSEREFSLAVLKALEQEIQIRAELMKSDGSGRANITEYRTATGECLSRVVVVMDEFHELFEEPDRIGQEAFAAFSNIVRMGPFSGVHMVVASQTLSSMPAMDRPTLMLLPQRVTFTCTEYDAELLMGSMNHAPLRLSKTGEGVFNPARGEESRNQLFQGLHIPADQRTELLSKLTDKARASGWTRLPRVFDGDAVVPRPYNRPADESAARNRLSIAVGEPFSLDDAERIALRRSRGSNLLLVGSGVDTHDHTLRGALHSCLLAASAQSVPTTIIDFAGDDDDAGIALVEIAQAVGARYVRTAGASAELASAALKVAVRTEAADYTAPTELLVIVGLERALSLKPSDPYASAPEAPSDAAATLATLQGGPEVGVHVIVQADRAKTIEARLGPEVLQELSLRIGSAVTDQIDLSVIAGHYGDVSPLRFGQLLVGDQAKGTVKRIRGYRVVTVDDLPNSGETE
jgi:S-DNA-T family DNA segregation ATPase FtsK/SpoIIIE